jgi:hypothetical protein
MAFSFGSSAGPAEGAAPTELSEFYTDVRRATTAFASV